jgi:hypothetical protein
MMIEDLPTLSLTATHITGALAAQRSRNVPPQQPSISTGLHDLFMAIMEFYSERREIAMSLPLIKTLDLAGAAIRTHRAEFLILNLLIEIIERDIAAVSDPGVRLALAQASTALNHAFTP